MASWDNDPIVGQKKEKKKPWELDEIITPAEATPLIKAPASTTAVKPVLPDYLSQPVKYATESIKPKQENGGLTIPAKATGTQAGAFGKNLLKEGIYGAGRFAQVVEKPVFALSAAGAGITGAVAGAIGQPGVKKVLDEIYDYYSQPEKNAPVSSIIDPERERRSIEAKKQSFAKGLINDIGEQATDMIQLMTQMSVLFPTAPIAGSLTTETGGALAGGIGRFVQNTGKVGLYSALTTQGTAGERIKNGLMMVANNLTAPIANATGAVGLKAATIDYALNAAVNIEPYWNAIKTAEGPQDLVYKLLPQIAMDIRGAWNTRGLPENQMKAQIKKQYSMSDINKNMTLDEYAKYITGMQGTMEPKQKSESPLPERKGALGKIITNRAEVEKVGKTVEKPESTIGKTINTSVDEPSQIEIESRAKQLWEAKGKPQGKDAEIWNEAKQDLISQKLLARESAFPAEQKPTGRTVAREGLQERVADLPVHIQRAFIDSGELQLERQQYKIKENQEVADKWIMENADNFSTAEGIFKDETIDPVQRGIAGMAMIKRLDAEGTETAQKQAVEIYDALSGKGTKFGQYNAAMKVWKEARGETWYQKFKSVLTEKKIDIDSVLTPDQIEAVKKSFADINKLPKGSEERSSELEKAIIKATQLLPKWKDKGFYKDVFNSFRYTNMLSSPMTHLVNVSQNLLNIAGWQAAKHGIRGIISKDPLRGIKYEADMFKGLPKAWQAAKDALSRPSLFEEGNVDTAAKGPIQRALRARVPKALRLTGEALGAADKFFSVLVEAGEKSRLMKTGKYTEAEAETIAKKLSDKMLYREAIRSQKEISEGGDISLAVKEVERIGSFFQKATEAGGITGAASSALMPFIRTSTNIIKQGVQTTPLGLTGKPKPGLYEKSASYNRRLELWADNQTQATLGSMVMLMGAGAAAAGLTTGQLPDDKAKENMNARVLGYAAGRQQWSIEGPGGVRIPMAAFGIGFIPLALGTIVHDAIRDNPSVVRDKEWNDRVIWAIKQSSRVVMQPSSVKGMQSFIGALTGEYDKSLKATAGFGASQFVPLSATQRFFNRMYDPRFIKSTGFKTSFLQNIAFMTKGLEGYKGPDKKESKRQLGQIISPFPLTTENQGYENRFLSRVRELQKKK